MFTTTSIYFLMLFLIFWGYCGYHIFLFAFAILRPCQKRRPTGEKKPSRIALIVPCHNEESLVEAKIDNLKELEYDPDKLEVYFLDGLSDDGTAAAIGGLIAELPNYHLVETGCRGKINQINHVLPEIRQSAEIIVNTDMDTILSPDVLRKIVEEFASDDRVAVVGANISPESSISLEEDYWRDQNLLRIIESKVYTSSIVVAPCYAYRASLIDRFPDDCIADDVYAAFRANTEGFLTKYIESAKGLETRTPATLDEFLRHKFRKGNAYLVELLRFFYRLPRMSGWWKAIYLTKLLQMAVLPWVLPYFLLSTISLALSSWGLFQIAFFGLIFLLGFFVVTSLILDRFRRKYYSKSKARTRPTVILFIISNLIMIFIGLSFPFYRQSSSYQKIRE